jgi:hypothetical protein
VKALGRLGLYDEPLVDDHVEGLPGERFPFVIDHNGNLAIHLVTFGDEIAFEGERVDVLAIPESEFAVHVEKRANHGVAELVL